MLESAWSEILSLGIAAHVLALVATAVGYRLASLWANTLPEYCCKRSESQPPMHL